MRWLDGIIDNGRESKETPYGYAHTMEDHIVARLQTAEEESFIKHLEFSGAHQISGDGMGPAVTNGRKAAKNVLDTMAKEAQ